MEFKFYNRGSIDNQDFTSINKIGEVIIRRSMLEILSLNIGDKLIIATNKDNTSDKDLYLFKSGNIGFKITKRGNEGSISINPIIKQLNIEPGKFDWEHYKDNKREGIKININNGRLL